jgi:aromatic ring hydroxylase
MRREIAFLQFAGLWQSLLWRPALHPHALPAGTETRMSVEPEPPPATADFIVSKPVAANKEEPNLRNGSQFAESLRDGRSVILDGRDVEDVTREPTLKRGIDTLAGYYDAQFDAASRDALTTVDEDSGERTSTAWLVPMTKEHLWQHERMMEWSTYHTFGVFGRPPDYGPVKAVSFVAWNHLIGKDEPDGIHKIRKFLEVGRANNLTSADVIVDVQANRKLEVADFKAPLRVVEERRDGVIVSGAKAGNSVMAQGNIGTISMPPPSKELPEECMIWAAVPANAPGLKLLLREAMMRGDESPEDHPLEVLGEEADGILIFDRVFIPWDNVFSYRNKVTGQIYTTIGRFPFWKIATRLSYRAEIFAGLTQTIVTALGTDHIQPVRALVAEVCQYAAILRGMMTAAVETAEPTESGVMLPNHEYVTAGRLYAIENYPKIMQIMRELSGQGLISRVPQRTWEREDVSALLDEYLPGHTFSALEKNRLFNLAWDICCSPHAMRVALFENINATPPAALKEEIYRSFDRSRGTSAIKKRLGMD